VFGRKDELMITGGHNVFPGQVEQVLRTHVSVTYVAVIGRPDEKWGTAVTAVVVPSDPANPPTLRPSDPRRYQGMGQGTASVLLCADTPRTHRCPPKDDHRQGHPPQAVTETHH